MTMHRVVLFVFSSRRRHTREASDWSSDVCSSDLLGWVRRTRLLSPGRVEGDGRGPEAQGVAVLQAAPAAHALPVEERAVAREAIVEELPIVLDPLEPAVQA